MKIETIYPAFMGEVNEFGIGAPCVFVRTAGCNLRCYKKTLGCLCDTPEALDGRGGKEMTPDQVVTEVRKYGFHLVCLTGGEPLLQSMVELTWMVAILGEYGIRTVIETNGSVDIQPFLHSGASFVLDYKAESTGENSKMLMKNWGHLLDCDWVKFVIYDEADVDEMFRVLKECPTRARIAAGLFWGSDKMTYGKPNSGVAQHLLARISEHPEYNIYLNMQTHKLICLYDENLSAAQKIIAPKDL